MALGPERLEYLGRQKAIAAIESARPVEMRFVHIPRSECFDRKQTATILDSVILGGLQQLSTDPLAMTGLVGGNDEDLNGYGRIAR